ncbi:MarR family winged helix-turn-helix transcriptional regulator [Streptomyces sp. NPDC059766]|uniref:MarR family winged helix-turn-helix transcriptional regulator n=1 Tax=Streptomyces sp. NPDC059766 TaxID=3346940 RepID=UPI003647AEFE
MQTVMSTLDPSGTTRLSPSVLPSLALLHGELRMLHGLSLHEYLVLGVVGAAEGRAVPVAELTASLKESGTRMTFVLKGLQAAGLIERDRRAGDRRTVEVTLTRVGRARLAEAEGTARTWLRGHADLQPAG